MDNINIPQGLFQPTSHIRNKDYQTRLNQLRNFNVILEETEIEKHFISNYLSQKLSEKREKSSDTEVSLSAKELEKHTSYASEGFRCNILSRMLKLSVRELSMAIAMSPDYLR